MKHVYRPGLEAEQTIQQYTKDLLSNLPQKLGTPELIPGCEVIDLDPFAVATLPRDITVRINEYQLLVTYRGSPTPLAVGDLVLVAHLREANLYEVVGISGSGGSSPPAGLYLSIWVYDVSLGLLLEYPTINAALAYAALAAGDYVLIGPGTYDEAITLVNGVIITEMVPGTVIIDSTAANTAVTTIGGGYIQVKEIRVTRANNNINAVLASHAAGDCTIYAELIRTENGGTGDSMGVNQTGAGNLFIFANDVQANGGDGDAMGAQCSAGAQVIVANCLAENGSGSFSVGAYCLGGAQTIYGDCTATDDDDTYGALCVGGATQIIRGHCTATTAVAFSTGHGVYCTTAGSVQVIYGDCEATAVAWAAGADLYRHTQTIHGNCTGTSTGVGSTSFGARCRHDSIQAVWGNCTATGGTTSIGAYTQAGIGAPVQRVNGDATGDFYGAQCEDGTQTITNGRATGATADLRQTGGTMQVFSVEHDTVVGTIAWLNGTSLQSFREYAQGLVIFGGAADWTVLAHPGPANRVLQSTAAEIAWSANAVTFPAAGAVPVGTGANTQVAYWTGANTLAGDAGMTYNAGTDTLTLAGGLALIGGANAIITVNDNVANAMTLVDAGALEYLRVISTDAQPVVVWNEGGADIDFRWEGVGADPALFIQGSDGKVGIGTAAPLMMLHIEGLFPNIYFNDSAGGDAFSIRADGTGNLLFTNETDAELAFLIDGAGVINLSTVALGRMVFQISVNSILDASNGVTYTDGLFKKPFTGEGSLNGIGPNLGSSVFNTAVLGDTGRRVVLTAGGIIQFGVGAGVTDTAIARAADGGLVVAGNLVAIPLANLARFEVDTAAAATKGLIIRGAAAQAANLQEWQDSTPTTLSVVTAAGWLGVGTPAPATLVELADVETLTGNVADDYAAAMTLDPGYTGAWTVTRHNYIDVQDVSLAGGAVVTNAALLRFDAGFGVHAALAAAFNTTDTNGDTTAWAGGVIINVNGTLYKLVAIAI